MHQFGLKNTKILTQKLNENRIEFVSKFHMVKTVKCCFQSFTCTFTTLTHFASLFCDFKQPESHKKKQYQLTIISEITKQTNSEDCGVLRSCKYS